MPRSCGSKMCWDLHGNLSDKVRGRQGEGSSSCGVIREVCGCPGVLIPCSLERHELVATRLLWLSRGLHPSKESPGGDFGVRCEAVGQFGIPGAKSLRSDLQPDQKKIRGQRGSWQTQSSAPGSASSPRRDHPAVQSRGCDTELGRNDAQHPGSVKHLCKIRAFCRAGTSQPLTGSRGFRGAIAALKPSLTHPIKHLLPQGALIPDKPEHLGRACFSFL